MNDRESLIRAVLLNPRCMVARSVLADFLEGIGEPDEAAAYLERRRVWPYEWPFYWSPGPEKMYCWFRGDAKELRKIERLAALPPNVFRHLKGDRGGGPYAHVVMCFGEDEALDDLAEAAAKAFGLVARPV